MLFVVFFITTSVALYILTKREGEYILLKWEEVWMLEEGALLYAVSLLAMSTLIP